VAGRAWAVGFGIWVIGAGSASAQLAIGRSLDSAFADKEGGWLTFKPSRESPFLLSRASYRLGVTSRRNGHVADLYQELVFGTELFVPVTPALIFRASYESGAAAGRYANGHAHGNGSFAERMGATSLTWRVNERDQAELGVRQNSFAGELDSTLVANSVPAIGRDPRLTPRLRRTTMPLTWSRQIDRATQADLRLSFHRGSGDLFADRVDVNAAASRLKLPLDVAGTGVGFSVRRKAGDHLYELSADQEHGSKDGVATLDGASVGPSHFGVQSRSLGLAVSQPWRRGTLRLHYENVFSKADLNIFVPHPEQLGYSVPPNTTAYGTGSLTARRTEVGARWTTGSEDAGSTLAYRHVYLPFLVRGAFVAQEFLFTVGSEGEERFSHVNLGIFSYSQRFRAGRARVELGLEQIIPFRLRRDGETSGGTAGGGGSKTFGGTTLSAALRLPF